jgi:hypothetical protein
MKSLYITALSLALSGCWSGSNFYTLAEGEAAIPAGKYAAIYTYDNQAEQVDDDPFENKVTISYASDGHIVISGPQGDESSNATLVKLGSNPSMFVVQADLGANVPKIGSAVYGLVELLPNGYRVAVPRCDQRRLAQWDRAIVSGVLVGKPFCRFSNRESFETAMLEYAKNPIGWTEYRRIK